MWWRYKLSLSVLYRGRRGDMMVTDFNRKVQPLLLIPTIILQLHPLMMMMMLIMLEVLLLLLMGSG
jgi:hypothetical protein